jgi:hypothetical protein
MAVTPPIAVGNLSAAIPVQTHSYPYYFPEYYGGYGQYYPSYDYYPYLVYAVPTRVGFGFGFFHHHVPRRFDRVKQEREHRGVFLRSGFLRRGLDGGVLHGDGSGGRR